MKSLILSAGYATRLYPLTLNTPESLLSMRNKPLIDYIVERVAPIKQVDQIYVISNDKFFRQFEEWLNSRQDLAQGKVRLINDGSTSEENRLGAIGDIHLAIAEHGLRDDLLVIAGDNIFDFDLNDFIRFACEKRPHHAVCLYLPQHNHFDPSAYGIAQLGEGGEVIGFEEKPAEPKSNLIATCIYFFPKEKLELVSEYLNLGRSQDTPGSYFGWLTQRDKVYGRILDGSWCDLGDIASITQALIQLASRN